MGFEWLPAKKYKRHYICLNCQKGFKRPPEKDMKNPEANNLSNLMSDYYSSGKHQDLIEYINDANQKTKATCPHCKNAMIQVHYDFEVPPQRDSRAWKKLQASMAGKANIKYDTFINWHRLELKQPAVSKAKSNLLKQNLAKLERINNS
ncbi:MAG: hypothetical protein AAF502_07285 [Bacteroidota bacterium]